MGNFPHTYTTKSGVKVTSTKPLDYLAQPALARLLLSWDYYIRQLSGRPKRKER